MANFLCVEIVDGIALQEQKPGYRAYAHLAFFLIY